MKLQNKLKLLLSAIFISLLIGCAGNVPQTETQPTEIPIVSQNQTLNLEDVPQYSGSPYVEINGNNPFFHESEYTTEAFETYSELDSLGRCGVAYANICQEIMPTKERGEIGMVKPTGWHTVKYDCIADRYLYNRCHLIGFQLAGENANEKNLITGTRFLNVTGMLPFENEVADYVRQTGHHVLYRVTPCFEGNNLVASGILMEAASVEDSEIRFNVYVYNVQPGVTIDYSTGDSTEESSTGISEERTFVLNTSSKKIHLPNCESVGKISEKNKQLYTGMIEALLKQGYERCKSCNP